MNKVIYKQVLATSYVQEVFIPEDAIIHHIGNQHGKPCMWYECTPDSPMTKMTIRMFFTGEKMPFIPGVYLEYLGTVLLNDDNFVVHFYNEA